VRRRPSVSSTVVLRPTSHEGHVGHEPVLDHLEDDRRRPELEERRDLAQVRVADDHVQPPVLLGIGVRLVARVDDRALQRRLEPDLGLEEVRALRELIEVPAAVVPLRLEPDLAGARDDLPRDEERRQVPRDVGERGRAVDEVVLVRPVRVALAVGVVLVDRERWPGGHLRRHLVQRPLEDPLPRLVVDHEISHRQAFGRGVLGVRVIDVVASPVRQDHVREAEILIGRLTRRHRFEPARVPQRRLVFVIPPDPSERTGER
jgi:hypothetical protein